MFEYKGKTVHTDNEGYLLNHNDWEEGMIALLAKQEGIELTEAHLEVVHFVRAFYEEFNTSPAIRMLVKAIQKLMGQRKVIVSIYSSSLNKAQPNKQQNWQAYPNPQSAYKISKSVIS